MDAEEVLVRGVLWNNAVFVVKLHILILELNGAPV